MQKRHAIPVALATAAAGVAAAVVVGTDPLAASTTTVQPVRTDTAIVSVKGKTRTVKVKVKGKTRTIRLPGHTEIVNGQPTFVPGPTVALPPTTVTKQGPTKTTIITGPGTTVTVTLPGTTVTEPGTTVTVTETTTVTT